VTGRASAIHTVTSLAATDLAALADGLAPGTRWVVGIGGGVALDAAKWCSWRRGTRLLLAPGLVSVDAMVTNTVAVREGGGIVYRGFVVADRIVVDPDLVGRAPARLNRAGVGDLLSIHTGLADWRLGAAAGSVAFDEEVAASAAAVLDRVEAVAPGIAAVSAAGLDAIVHAYAEVNALCLRVGHSGPEEGSEHYFGYHLEQVTGRSFVHGELIGLGTVIMATLQENDPARAVRILDTCRVAWRPEEQGLERGVLVEALAGLPTFVRSQGLPHSIIDEADLSPASASVLLDRALADAVPVIGHDVDLPIGGTER
jgi:glycerol-1-phosphate dehydrogenase [NAD(P)+]